MYGSYLVVTLLAVAANVYAFSHANRGNSHQRDEGGRASWLFLPVSSSWPGGISAAGGGDHWCCGLRRLGAAEVLK